LILIIDNYDSFTYNLYQYVGEIDGDVKVYRNDEITIEELKKMSIDHIIISPGPGFPKDSGISTEVIRTFGKYIPILGVCLGHQAIGEVFGGRIIHADEAVHGKTSMIYHDGTCLFKGLPNPLKVVRYHSLVVDNRTIPGELMVTAKSSQGEVMGLRHRKYPIYGLQFHPESISTDGGKEILNNFLKIT